MSPVQRRGELCKHTQRTTIPIIWVVMYIGFSFSQPFSDGVLRKTWISSFCFLSAMTSIFFAFCFIFYFLFLLFFNLSSSFFNWKAITYLLVLNLPRYGIIPYVQHSLYKVKAWSEQIKPFDLDMDHISKWVTDKILCPHYSYRWTAMWQAKYIFGYSLRTGIERVRYCKWESGPNYYSSMKKRFTKM